MLVAKPKSAKVVIGSKQATKPDGYHITESISQPGGRAVPSSHNRDTQILKAQVALPHPKIVKSAQFALFRGLGSSPNDFGS